MSARGDKNKQSTSESRASQQIQQVISDNNPTQRKPANRKTYVFLLDSVPYSVTAEPFTFNSGQRYYVTVNGGPEYIFSWDPEMGRLAAIDVDASILPDALEQEISARLEAEI